MTELGKMLILFGGLILLIGVLLTLSGKIPWLGRLPGDIFIQRGYFSFYFPLATSLLVSALLSLLFFLLRR
jgi:membrane protein implicated in regulation of membrane protease activity